MIYLVIYSVSFFASAIGAICDIGGGVVIKPVLDAVGVFSVSTASFLSGCTVLSMSAYSVACNMVGKGKNIDLYRATFLGIGGAVSGIVGKELFEKITGVFADVDTVGAVQEAVLLLITGATVAYTLRKAQIRTKQMAAPVACVVVGLALGIMFSFLGIGGGPINLVVLTYCFSMPTKVAAQNSLYTILLSQLGSLLQTICTGSVPVFSWLVLIGMVLLGVLGGAVGRTVNRRIDAARVDRLFLGLLFLIMGICVYNFFRFI